MMENVTFLKGGNTMEADADGKIYSELFKEIDLKKFQTSRIDACPVCESSKIVRMKKDHYHGEILCEQCGAVIEEQITIDEIPEICVSDRELEIELNTYRLKSKNSLEKTRIGGLTKYPGLMVKYDRSSEGNKKKWRAKMYKDFVGVVNTHFHMTKTQQIRVKEAIDYHEDIKELHRQANYESIITALCILSMKRDKRRVSFDNKGMNKAQLEFINEIGLTEKKYIKIMENCNFPMIKTHHLNKRIKPFKFKNKRYK